MANFSFVGGQTSNTYTDAMQASMIRVVEHYHHARLLPSTVSSHVVMAPDDSQLL
jgi:hypothetical protein